MCGDTGERKAWTRRHGAGEIPTASPGVQRGSQQRSFLQPLAGESLAPRTGMDRGAEAYAAIETLTELWKVQKKRVEKYDGEQMLEEQFIQPVLRALGWKDRMLYQTFLRRAQARLRALP